VPRAAGSPRPHNEVWAADVPTSASAWKRSDDDSRDWQSLRTVRARNEALGDSNLALTNRDQGPSPGRTDGFFGRNRDTREPAAEHPVHAEGLFPAPRKQGGKRPLVASSGGRGGRATLYVAFMVWVVFSSVLRGVTGPSKPLPEL